MFALAALMESLKPLEAKLINTSISQSKFGWKIKATSKSLSGTDEGKQNVLQYFYTDKAHTCSKDIILLIRS